MGEGHRPRTRQNTKLILLVAEEHEKFLFFFTKLCDFSQPEKNPFANSVTSPGFSATV